MEVSFSIKLNSLVTFLLCVYHVHSNLMHNMGMVVNEGANYHFTFHILILNHTKILFGLVLFIIF